jgi:hypothetical protein
MSSLPLPVGSVIDEFNVGPLTVERRVPPDKNQYGAFDAAVGNNIVIDPVAAHNLTGRDLNQVPEADRNSEVVQFYTKVRLFVADGGFAADIVTYQDRRFRIVRVRDFDPQGGIYCAFGALEDVQAVP